MPPAHTPHPSARAVTWGLALAAAAVFAFGSVPGASADSGLSACATINGSDGHPYHWSAPC